MPARWMTSPLNDQKYESVRSFAPSASNVLGEPRSPSDDRVGLIYGVVYDAVLRSPMDRESAGGGRIRVRRR